MKIKASRGGATISVNPRHIGEGLVIAQGAGRIILSPAEWAELRAAADTILAEGNPA